MQAVGPEPSADSPALTCLPVRSRFFVRPQLLTRGSLLPAGRDIARSTLLPGIRTVRARVWAEMMAPPRHLSAAILAWRGGGQRGWMTSPHTPCLHREESAMETQDDHRRPAWGISRRELLHTGLAAGVTLSAWACAPPQALGGEAAVSTNEICRMDAVTLAGHIRAKRLSPVEVIDAVLDRMDKLEPILHAFCTPTPDLARATAKQIEASRRATRRTGSSMIGS